MAELKLRKPLDYNGTHYDVLEYDLNSLTGDDLSLAEMEARRAGQLLPGEVPETNKAYQRALFALAAKIDFAMTGKMSGKDAMDATTAVMLFFGE